MGFELWLERSKFHALPPFLQRGGRATEVTVLPTVAT